MKVYTKGGDKGSTSLVGGARVEKSHPRLEAYGNVDELTAVTGALYDILPDQGIKHDLCRIMERLMVCAALLASEEGTYKKLPKITEADILFLEAQIDLMDAELPPLKNFVFPCGHPVVSGCHVARTVCRRAERSVVRLMEGYQADPLVLTFLNRLSDYFFMLSRKSARLLEVEEIRWIPKL
ncbi:MAG: cob(I)yrinic acid a,c-diamide adenosyltransferase [Bacteroidales bacterium]